MPFLVFTVLYSYSLHTGFQALLQDVLANSITWKWTLMLGDDTTSAVYRHGLVGSVSQDHHLGLLQYHRLLRLILSKGPPPLIEDPPATIPQLEDIHAYIALNGDLAPHPAEYPDAPANRLWFKSYRIAAANKA
ncbi:hypothetical protein EDB86DRAFT_2830576 [Lactarius hatsudake]|nr:hypothetical protein EDB86DRAFT_2830576 [Lactarius hatsudake]